MELAASQKSLVWYHPELDVLRFCAFCMVFIFHDRGGLYGTMYSPGAFGVDLFFALSAYLITEILLREQRAFGTFDIRKFYIRRILRIWPLYFAFLIICIPLDRMLLPKPVFPVSVWLMFVFFVGNWQYLIPVQIHTVAGLLWSVCVEEQFYLTWPLLMRRWSQKLPWICGGLFCVSTAYRMKLYLLGPFDHPVNVYWKNTFVHMDPILVGSLLAFFLKGGTLRLTPVSRALVAAAGVCGVLVAGWFGMPGGGRALLTYPLAAVSCGAILVATLRPIRKSSAPPGKVRNGLIHLGRISYGLYVFHSAAIATAGKIRLAGHPLSTKLLQPCVAFLLTLLVAEISYRLLELPFLRLKDRFSAVKSAPVSLPAPIVASSAAV